MEPHGQARGTSMKYPPTPACAEPLRPCRRGRPRLRRVIHQWRNPPKHQFYAPSLNRLLLTHSSTGKTRACTPKYHFGLSFSIEVPARRRGLLRRWIKRRNKTVICIILSKIHVNKKMDCPWKNGHPDLWKRVPGKRDAQKSFKQAAGQFPGCPGAKWGCQLDESVWLK